MPKAKKELKRVRLSQDALFFLHRIFPHNPRYKTSSRDTVADLLGKTLTPRAIEASCELIEAGFISVEINEQIYTLLQVFPDPPFKLQRIREAYDAFDPFMPHLTPEAAQKEIQKIAAFNPLIEVMGDISRVQTDLLDALRYPCVRDPVAQIHVKHAIQALQRLAAEGVKSLETVLE